MGDSLIKTMFVIIGTLLVSILMYTLIFTQSGQQFIWNAVRPAMTNHWNESSLDSGQRRSKAYDEFFKIESDKYIKGFGQDRKKSLN